MSKGSESPAFRRLWRFVLAVYGAPGAKEACLRLQDGQGLDVTLLLYFAFARPCSDAAIRRADRATRRWREAVILPIRRARRGAGEQPDLRKMLLRAELRAEREAVRRLSLLPIARTPAEAEACLTRYAALFASRPLGRAGRAAIASIAAAASRPPASPRPSGAPARRPD